MRQVHQVRAPCMPVMQQPPTRMLNHVHLSKVLNFIASKRNNNWCVIKVHSSIEANGFYYPVIYVQASNGFMIMAYSITSSLA